MKMEYVFDILNDQKVVPMIRGKATEYNAFIVIEQHLSKSEWSVQKLNLNAQTNSGDEDISITHRRTGIVLKVESKPKSLFLNDKKMKGWNYSKTSGVTVNLPEGSGILTIQ